MSTSTFHFLDVNVWLALAHEIHPQHGAAITWDETLDADAVLDSYLFIRKQEYFNNFKQLGAVG